jgi:hypothetical protein
LILCAGAEDPTELWVASAGGETMTTARVFGMDVVTGAKPLQLSNEGLPRVSEPN